MNNEHLPAQGPVDVNVRPAEHHPWCNFWLAGPANECKQCKGLYERYPIDGKTVDKLAEQYFPDAVKRPNASFRGGPEARPSGNDS